MKPNEREEMRIQFDAHQCELTAADEAQMREDIVELARQVADFPISDVKVLVERNARSNDYSVKITLTLPGETLVGNDHDPVIHAAFERCLVGLVENIKAYKER